MAGGVSAGFNVLDPEPVAPIHPDCRIRFGVLGGAYYFNSQTLIYAEWKLEDSVNAVGLDQPNAFVRGVRLDFGLPELQRNDAPPLRFPESDGEGTRRRTPARRTSRGERGDVVT